jgi:nitrate/nitrite-specific signal transduction histidine kinase/ligand-binding sensor domain-containing protein
LKIRFFGLLTIFCALLTPLFVSPVGVAAVQSDTVPSLKASETAPPPIYPGSEMRFERYSNDQGLSMSVVNSIAQDQQGFLWFATQDGLNRFDAHHFRIYKHDPDNPDSLSANWINTLLVDSQGIHWIGTSGGGLDRYNPTSGKFTHYQFKDDDPYSISDNMVNVIYEDRSGILWVGTAAGLDQLDRQSGKFTHQKDNPAAPELIKNGEITAITQDRDGFLWFGTKEGLVSLDPETSIYILYQNDPANPNSLSMDGVTDILEDRAGNLWIGTNGGGVNRLLGNGSTFDSIVLGDVSQNTVSAGSAFVKTILEDPHGRLWIGTWGAGLFYYDPRTGKSIQYRSDIGNPNSLSADYIVQIFRDQSGSTWIGTFGGGLSKFDAASQNFVHYRKNPNLENSLISNIVWAIHADESDLWIGTDSGLDRLERETGLYTHFRYDPDDLNSLPANNVQAIYRDSRGSIWVGTGGGGLALFDSESEGFKSYRNDPANPNSLSSDKVTAIAEDPLGELWIGTKGGLNKFDNEKQEFTRFVHDKEQLDTLNSDAITALTASNTGKFWIGTYAGLNLFDPVTGIAERFVINPGQQEDYSELEILSIHEAREGILWIGTLGRGLVRFDPLTGETRNFHEKDGLPNDTIYGILEDDAGQLWMSTNNGLGRFDPEALKIKVFTARDGLQANEFNSFAYFESQDGEMFFGGINGVSAFYPPQIQENSYLPPVVLVSLTSGGRPISDVYPVEQLADASFQYPRNSFEFEFAGLSYIQPESNQYAYLLENFDSDWVYVGNLNFGRYTNLPGGSYRLRLRAANNDGVWNEASQPIQIRVIPPFWQTLWFRLGLILITAAIVYAGYRLRVRSVFHRSRQLEMLVNERTKEIERRRQELEALYSADEALYRNLHLDQVLQALVESAVKLLDADKGSLLVVNDEKTRLVARVTHGFKPETVKLLSLAFGEGIAGLVAMTGEPILVQDVDADPRVAHQITKPENIRSIMQVPIKVGGEVFGVFSADFIRPHSFENDELRLLISLAQRAGLAIQNAQLYEQTQQKAIVEERNRLARELHDAVTQTLFSASLIAEALPTAFDTNPKEGRELLAELRQLSRGALAEMRALLMELRPSALAEANLEDLLRQLGEAAAGREGIPVIVQTNGHTELPSDVHIALYRIAQEALNNALKHARAGHILIKLAKYSQPSTATSEGFHEGIELTVQDDGRGFDPGKTPSDHLGLNIMRERAQSIGAELAVESQQGGGTQVTVLWENNNYN